MDERVAPSAGSIALRPRSLRGAGAAPLPSGSGLAHLRSPLDLLRAAVSKSKR